MTIPGNGSYSVSKKLILIAILSILVLIPTTMIISLINERHEYKNQAQEDVTSKWGKTQRIGNLILYIPYNDDKIVQFIKVLPETLSITGKVDTEIRYRGIFKFVLYKGNVSLTGNINKPDLSKLNINPESVLWDKAFLQMEITDLVGLKDVIKLKWNGTVGEFCSGLEPDTEIKTGVMAPAAFNPIGNNSFDINISLRGSEELYFYPNGKVTTVDLDANWNNSSYIGAFLPDSHTFLKGVEKAHWKVLDLNRSYPQQWTGNYASDFFQKSSFGLKFLFATDVYKESTRAVKYMFLFVGLTFIIFFLIEIIHGRRIHPFQYLLVSFALLIFYLLLLSLSEQIGFNLAYLISAVSIIILIAFYAVKILGSKMFALLVSGSLTLLYGFLYILLRNQDYSLLLGSIGLFVILALIMYFSRNINWYREDD